MSKRSARTSAANWGRLLVVSLGLCAAAGGVALAEDAANKPNLDVEYFPTPRKAVDKMLEVAHVTKSDFLIDLGSGDGRIPITAAQRYGTKALGVDLDPDRISDANENAQKAGVTDKVTFRQQDLFQTDIRSADVLTMFLLGSINIKLRPRILAEMKPGARVVSYAFNMGDWKPDRTEIVDGQAVYLWIVPKR